MNKKQLTESQKELVAIVPQEAQKNLTTAAILILGVLIRLECTEQAKENGYVFRSNEALLKDTGIGSKSTLINAIAQLQSRGLISTLRGRKRELGIQSQASRYKVASVLIKPFADGGFEESVLIEDSNCTDEDNCTVDIDINKEDKCTVDIDINGKIDVNIKKDSYKDTKDTKGNDKDKIGNSSNGELVLAREDTHLPSLSSNNLSNETDMDMEHEWNESTEIAEAFAATLADDQTESNWTDSANDNVVSVSSLSSISSDIDEWDVNLPSFESRNKWLGDQIERMKRNIKLLSKCKTKAEMDAVSGVLRNIKAEVSPRLKHLTQKQQDFFNSLLKEAREAYVRVKGNISKTTEEDFLQRCKEINAAQAKLAEENRLSDEKANEMAARLKAMDFSKGVMATRQQKQYSRTDSANDNVVSVSSLSISDECQEAAPWDADSNLKWVDDIDNKIRYLHDGVFNRCICRNDVNAYLSRYIALQTEISNKAEGLSQSTFESLTQRLREIDKRLQRRGYEFPIEEDIVHIFQAEEGRTEYKRQIDINSIEL